MPATRVAWLAPHTKWQANGWKCEQWLDRRLLWRGSSLAKAVIQALKYRENETGSFIVCKWCSTAEGWGNRHFHQDQGKPEGLFGKRLLSCKKPWSPLGEQIELRSKFRIWNSSSLKDGWVLSRQGLLQYQSPGWKNLGTVKHGPGYIQVYAPKDCDSPIALNPLRTFGGDSALLEGSLPTGRKTLQRLPLHSNSPTRRHPFLDARLKTRFKSQHTQASINLRMYWAWRKAFIPPELENKHQQEVWGTFLWLDFENAFSKGQNVKLRSNVRILYLNPGKDPTEWGKLMLRIGHLEESSKLIWGVFFWPSKLAQRRRH